MIFAYILSLVVGAYAFLLSLLPNQSSADIQNVLSMNNAIGTIRSYLITANFWFPVDDLFTIIKLMIAVELAIGFFILARYIAHILTVGIVK